MPTIPRAPIFLTSDQFQTDEGEPAAGYKIYTYVAGSSTPTTLFTDATANTPAANPYIMNAFGRPDDTLFLPNTTGVKLILTTEDGPDDPDPIPPGDVTIATDDDISSPGAVAFENFGTLITEHSQLGMTDGQQIAEGTTYATIDGSVNPTTVYLPSAAATTFPLTIMNVDTANDAQVVRDGTDIFLGGAQLVDLPAGTSPTYSGMTVVSDGVSTWRFLSFWTS